MTRDVKCRGLQLETSHRPFNAHPQRAVLVFMDEAFWAGDKQRQGRAQASHQGVHMLSPFEGLAPQAVRRGYRLNSANPPPTFSQGTRVRYGRG
jgi:hypothetical protein